MAKGSTWWYCYLDVDARISAIKQVLSVLVASLMKKQTHTLPQQSMDMYHRTGGG